MSIYESEFNLDSSEVIKISHLLNGVVYREKPIERNKKTIYIYDIDLVRKLDSEEKELLQRYGLKPKTLEEKATEVNPEKIE